MGVNISDLPLKAQQQIAMKLQLQTQQKKAKAKYNNEPVELNDIKFASRKEAKRYQELMLRLRSGRIQDLKLQPQFTLQESFMTPEGKRIRAIRYVADFSYFDCDRDKDVVEDVKTRATSTDKYKIKKKMMVEKFGIEIEEV